MSHDTFPAMGTTVDVWGDDVARLRELRRWIATVEACCSRFLEDSELSRLNAGSGSHVEVSALLAGVLSAAREMRERTGGLVDPGVGGRVVAWGYDRSFDEVCGPENEPGPGSRPRWDIEGGGAWLDPDTRIDLGGIAKGWAADRAVDRGLATVVSVGGDLRSADPRTVVDVRGSGGELLATVSLGIGGLATSSIARRNWQAAGRRVSHLIDPRTGDPVEGPVVSATVVAPTALEAEAAAKAVLLLGADGLAWAERQHWVGGALVEWHDGSVFATRGLEAA